MPTTMVPVTGTAAGVPFLAVPPPVPRPSAPVVVAWHLMDPPRTEAAFAAALPLRRLLFLLDKDWHGGRSAQQQSLASLPERH